MTEYVDKNFALKF